MARQSSGSGDASEASVEDLEKQIEALKTDLASLTETIGALGTAKGHEFAEAVRARRQEGQAALEDAAERLGRQTDEFLRTQPATSLGIAAGIGFLIGLIMARR